MRYSAPLFFRSHSHMRAATRAMWLPLLILASMTPIWSFQLKNVAPAPRVVPFSLHDVRLRSGPFLDALEKDKAVLLSIDPARLLHTFRINAGLPSNAKAYGGWEAPEVELRGHSLGHYLTACALVYALTDEKSFKARGEEIVRELATVQEALQQKGSTPGYLSAFPETFFDRVEKRTWVWAPYYTLHKILAGLLDMHDLCGDPEALRVARGMGDWVEARMKRLSAEEQQAMLQTEFGGMAEALAKLARVTGDARYLTIAQAFDHRVVFEPLMHHQDSLDGLHGNTQIPKMIGAVEEYALTSNETYLDMARFFWERVAQHRSYAIGGNTNDEHFFPVDDFRYNLGAASTETCNSYNMLRLTRALFTYEPSSRYTEFYERVLFNHILASQDPATGMVCYYVSMKPGAFKTYSTADSSFWCCVGTGMENPARAAEAIYYHDEHALGVNLFIASDVQWREKGVQVIQETRFPDESRTRLTIRAKSPTTFALHIRIPRWSEGNVAASLNDVAVPSTAYQDSAVVIDREWKDGDRVQFSAQMSVGTELLPGTSDIVALMYGPIVLAGDLGMTGMDNVSRYGPEAPEVRVAKALIVPTFVVASISEIPGHLKAVAGQPLTFRTDGLARPDEVTLRPFYKITQSRYAVYWNVVSPGRWDETNRHLSEQRSIALRRDRATIDRLDLSDRASEKRHAFSSEGVGDHWYDNRRARVARNGWMTFELLVDDTAECSLYCMFKGTPKKRGSFEVLVGSTVLKQESLDQEPPAFVEREYRIPPSLTKGRKNITVTLRSLNQSEVAPTFEVRTMLSEIN